MIPIKSTKSTISPRRAVEIARTYLKSIKPNTTAMVEEIELSNDRAYWFVTLSYPSNQPEGLFGMKTKRKYRIFKINSNTGEVLSMKIRALNIE